MLSAGLSRCFARHLPISAAARRRASADSAPAFSRHAVALPSPYVVDERSVAPAQAYFFRAICRRL